MKCIMCNKEIALMDGYVTNPSFDFVVCEHCASSNSLMRIVTRLHNSDNMALSFMHEEPIDSSLVNQTEDATETGLVDQTKSVGCPLKKETCVECEYDNGMVCGFSAKSPLVELDKSAYDVNLSSDDFMREEQN